MSNRCKCGHSKVVPQLQKTKPYSTVSLIVTDCYFSSWVKYAYNPQYLLKLARSAKKHRLFMLRILLTPGPVPALVFVPLWCWGKIFLTFTQMFLDHFFI
jgi:hypothetical protein